MNNRIPTTVVAATDIPDHRAFVIAIPVVWNVWHSRYPTAAYNRTPNAKNGVESALRLKQEIAVVSRMTMRRTYQYTRGMPIYSQGVVLFRRMDSIVTAIVAKFKVRAELGKAKYGTDMDRTDLSVLDWIAHAQEEHMDAIVYLEKLRQTLVGAKRS